MDFKKQPSSLKHQLFWFKQQLTSVWLVFPFIIVSALIIPAGIITDGIRLQKSEQAPVAMYIEPKPFGGAPTDLAVYLEAQGQGNWSILYSTRFEHCYFTEAVGIDGTHYLLKIPLYYRSPYDRAIDQMSKRLSDATAESPAYLTGITVKLTNHAADYIVQYLPNIDSRESLWALYGYRALCIGVVPAKPAPEMWIILFAVCTLLSSILCWIATRDYKDSLARVKSECRKEALVNDWTNRNQTYKMQKLYLGDAFAFVTSGGPHGGSFFFSYDEIESVQYGADPGLKSLTGKSVSPSLISVILKDKTHLRVGIVKADKSVNATLRRDLTRELTLRMKLYNKEIK